MFEYQRLMKDFDSYKMNIVLKSQFKLREKELIQVTYDEWHFYANDRQQRIWMKENEDILCLKHQGCFIIVSVFLCSCYGLL